MNIIYFLISDVNALRNNLFRTIHVILKMKQCWNKSNESIVAKKCMHGTCGTHAVMVENEHFYRWRRKFQVGVL